MINKIKNLIISNNLDGYIIPKNDDFFTEYSKTNKLHIISNFTGSAGFILILKKTNPVLKNKSIGNRDRMNANSFFPPC